MPSWRRGPISALAAAIPSPRSADVQAQNSYISAARQAMTWVPVLNLVLTIVFYAMFPVVFPLFLFPQTGPALLKGYLTGFFYLASWGRSMRCSICSSRNIRRPSFPRSRPMA
jgi:hypothetical protein